MRKIRSLAVAALMAGAVLASGAVAGAQPNAVYQWGGVGEGSGATHSNGLIPTAVGLTGVSALKASNSNSYAIVGTGEQAWGYGRRASSGRARPRRASHPSRWPSRHQLEPSLALVMLKMLASPPTRTRSGIPGAGPRLGTSVCPGAPTSMTPQPLPALGPVVAVAGGSEHVSWLTASGTVESCGQNNHGQLGNGTTTNSSTPVLSPA